MSGTRRGSETGVAAALLRFIETLGTGGPLAGKNRPPFDQLAALDARDSRTHDFNPPDPAEDPLHSCLSISAVRGDLVKKTGDQKTFLGKVVARFCRIGEGDIRDRRRGIGEGDIRNCFGKLNDPGKPAFRRLGILPQQLGTSRMALT